MLQGIKFAADAMVAAAQAQDVTANNIANTDTAGFRKETPVFRSFSSILQDTLRQDAPRVKGGVVLDATVTDRTQGRVVATENPWDVALVGEGYFAVETPSGIRYTRNGSFGLNRNMALVTQDGHPVLGQRGPIVLPERGDVSISADGVIHVDGAEWDRFAVVAAGEGGGFIKEGLNLYRYDGAGEPLPSSAEVLSGHLEMSTVNPIQEIVAMIAHLRGFESAQRAVQLQDSTLNKAVNEIGKIA